MIHSPKFTSLKRIVILAGPENRKELIEWSYAHKHHLNSHIIISTARTARLLEGTLNTPVLNLDHGRAGGYHQVKNMISGQQVDILLLFGDLVKIEKKETPFADLIHTALQQDIVVAYNRATIDMVTASIASGGERPSADSALQTPASRHLSAQHERK